MIDHLDSQFCPYSNIGVACLYADYKDQADQTLTNILGTFLRQLLTAIPEPIPDEIIQKLGDIYHGGRKVEAEDNLALLKIRLHQLKRAFICVDAIDELETKVRQQLLNVLKELVTKSNTCLFLTGRDHVESEVQKCFSVSQRHKVIISASQQDIQEFVRQEIEDHDLNPEAMDELLAEEIVDTITKKSQGM